MYFCAFFRLRLALTAHSYSESPEILTHILGMMFMHDYLRAWWQLLVVTRGLYYSVWECRPEKSVLRPDSKILLEPGGARIPSTWEP